MSAWLLDTHGAEAWNKGLCFSWHVHGVSEKNICAQSSFRDYCNVKLVLLLNILFTGLLVIEKNWQIFGGPKLHVTKHWQIFGHLESCFSFPRFLKYGSRFESLAFSYVLQYMK